MQLAGVIGEFVVVDRITVGAARVVVVGALVVDIVIPGRAADPRADVVVGDVQFRQQVEAVGDQALVEVAVTVVQVQRGLPLGELAARVLCTPGGAVFQGIVPAHPQVGVAGIEFEGLRLACGQRDKRQAEGLERR
ncbi:hypothetical protein D3C80_1117750 [compost metagenome]